jgi:excinuclease UvrABC nuclease subunit
MREEIAVLANKFEALVSSPFLTFDEVSGLKNKMGVYMIYEENRLIYVGKTNKFHIRFGTDLKHETTHTLVRKLIKKGTHLDRYEVTNFLKTKCRIRIEFCDTNRGAEALEAIAIFILNPELNRL